MINIWQKQILRFIGLVAIQVFILNNIQLNGYINPYLYIYFILLLPFETPKWLLLVSAFVLGLSIDLFSGTIGLHAAATVFMAYTRPGVLYIISSRREYEPGILPSISDLGFPWFFSYSALLIILHHFFFFFLEAFIITEFWSVFFRVVISSAFTLLLVIITQYLFTKKRR
jgi:hypothetical protein